ncbi:hypothetical protein [Humisphaera borealis]|uniref:CpXC domain-containing protein n=1 Tax=Humisphaera borealis TaxID=2807512 RepID=A0A7M2X2C9_9BACT|nr:hypothetical protein [Humisphaera borealis]QOV90910.1 hypothetical protein IPV69_05995 [Humisphaera borealis]
MSVLMEEPPVFATPPTRVADRGMFQLRQYCVCPRCETAIPTDCVLRHNLDEGEKDLGERRISIYCPACLSAYTAWFAISDGFARQASPISVVNDPALIDTLKGGLERVRGDRRVVRDQSPVPIAVSADGVNSVTLAQLVAQQELTQLKLAETTLALSVERALVRKLTAERRIPPNATACAPGGRTVQVAPSPRVAEAAALDVALAGEAQGLGAETQTFQERTIDHEFDQRPPNFDSDFGL